MSAIPDDQLLRQRATQRVEAQIFSDLVPFGSALGYLVNLVEVGWRWKGSPPHFGYREIENTETYQPMDCGPRGVIVVCEPLPSKDSDP